MASSGGTQKEAFDNYKITTGPSTLFTTNHLQLKTSNRTKKSWLLRGGGKYSRKEQFLYF
jgi:hypothetical protein